MVVEVRERPLRCTALDRILKNLPLARRMRGGKSAPKRRELEAASHRQTNCLMNGCHIEVADGSRGHLKIRLFPAPIDVP